MTTEQKSFVPLAKALTQIEAARHNLIETVNSLDLTPETLGRLATMDERIAVSEREFSELMVDIGCELKKQAEAAQ